MIKISLLGYYAM